MAKQEHVHKLRRHKYPNGTEVYFCVLDCHFKVETSFALGKKSICNICGEEFIMNEASIRQAKPHCTGCGKFKTIDENGKVRMVSKGRPQPALSSMAHDSVNSLKARLGKVVEMVKDEDI